MLAQIHYVLCAVTMFVVNVSLAIIFMRISHAKALAQLLTSTIKIILMDLTIAMLAVTQIV